MVSHAWKCSSAMHTLVRRAAPLTLVTVVALLQSAGVAGWWQTPIGPEAFAGLAIGLWVLGLFALASGGDTQPAITAAGPSTAGTVPTASATQKPGFPVRERRAHIRYKVTHPVLVEVRGLASTPATIRDISEGGARIANGPDLSAGSRGLLHIQGISLPVPFDAVSEAGSQDLRVKFDLEGLAHDAFIRQLQRLLATIASTPD